jgi:hypothetical protein
VHGTHWVGRFVRSAGEEAGEQTCCTHVAGLSERLTAA